MFLITSFAQGSSPSDRPLNSLRQLVSSVAAQRAERTRRREAVRRVRTELSSYNDRELSDLGIGRGDIETIAQQAVVSR